jgi:TonB family protein
VQLAPAGRASLDRFKVTLRTELPVPPGRRWAELSAEQQALVRSWYAELPAGDEPPFPEDGMRRMALAVLEVFQDAGLLGRMSMFVTVEANGRVSGVDVVQPHGSAAQRIAAALVAQRYKSGLCKGQPCRMQFPVRLKIEDPRRPRASAEVAGWPTLAVPTLVAGSCPPWPRLAEPAAGAKRILVATTVRDSGALEALHVLEGGGSAALDDQVLATLRQRRFEPGAGTAEETRRDGLPLLPLRAAAPPTEPSATAPAADRPAGTEARLTHCGPVAGDYPLASARAGEQGRARLRIAVAADGRIDAIELESSSGHARLDRATMGVVPLCSRAQPARDAAGAAVASQLKVEFVWQLD